MIEDGAFDQGSVTTVQRVGNTIRRPIGRWTPTVHALLRHLQRDNFSFAPHVLGSDSEGREILSLLPGEVARRPWPSVLRTDAGLIILAQALRAYHIAVQEFIPPANAEWFVPNVVWSPNQIVRHGDLGPWNTIWSQDQLIGFIDWDSIEPGTALEDFAQLVWYCIPLRNDEQVRAAGFDAIPDRGKRLNVLCQSYGALPAEVLVTLQQLQRKERERISRLAQRGIEPWVTFQSRGDVESIEAEAEWLSINYDSLIQS